MGTKCHSVTGAKKTVPPQARNGFQSVIEAPLAYNPTVWKAEGQTWQFSELGKSQAAPVIVQMVL